MSQGGMFLSTMEAIESRLAQPITMAVDPIQDMSGSMIIPRVPVVGFRFKAILMVKMGLTILVELFL